MKGSPTSSLPSEPMSLAERQDAGPLSLEGAASEEAPAAPSLDAVYRAHAATVARWVAHLGGPSIDVEDVVHEIFLVVRRQLAKFRGDAKLTSWLYRITARTVRDWRRKDRFRRFVRRTPPLSQSGAAGSSTTRRREKPDDTGHGAAVASIVWPEQGWTGS